jgi:hypothetical protein
MADTVVQALIDAHAREVSGEVRASFLEVMGRLGPLARPAAPLLMEIIAARPGEREVEAALRALKEVSEEEGTP